MWIKINGIFLSNGFLYLLFTTEINDQQNCIEQADELPPNGNEQKPVAECRFLN